MLVPDELLCFDSPPPLPLENLARALGEKYERLYKSLARRAQWPEVRLALELKGADFLALPIPGKRALLGYHLITTASTGLGNERSILGPAAGLALQAIMLPYAPAPPPQDARVARALRSSLPSNGLESLELSEGWARLNRSL